MLMPSTTPAATPKVVGWSGQDTPVVPPSIIYKMEAPRNDGDISVVSTAGTPMLKLVGELMSEGISRALARQE